MDIEVNWAGPGQSAKKARQNAYAPYSKFLVGASLVTVDGVIFSGCNIENASFGLTICAERVAMADAGTARFRTCFGLVIVAPKTISPCGACGQILREFRDFEVQSSSTESESERWQTAELLPMAIG